MRVLFSKLTHETPPPPPTDQPTASWGMPNRPPALARKAVRHALEQRIESASCEWREPNFMAERVQDILDDDVTHLFEGDFIRRNGRTRRETACFQDAVTQGSQLLESEADLEHVLQEYTRRRESAATRMYLGPAETEGDVFAVCPPLTTLSLPIGATLASPFCESPCQLDVLEVRAVLQKNCDLHSSQGRAWLTQSPTARRMVRDLGPHGVG